MVFSSHLFLFYFLPVVLLGYYLLPGDGARWVAGGPGRALRFLGPHNGRHLWLTLASYFFYGWANPLFVVLMMVSTLIDYIAGLAIAGRAPWRPGAAPPPLDPDAPRTRRQRAALVLSIVSNLSLLGFFKYFNFAVENYNGLASFLGFEGARLDSVMRIVLPLGISFYTFQSMSYTIDVYRGHTRALRNLLDFACYVALFPQLVAGPIVRFSDVADQLLARSHTLEKFARGAAFLALGLGKKILLANPCGKVADTCFGAGSIGVGDAWYGATAYAFQIYFDFSGYSDMAVGLGLMLGFMFAKNFDSPYRSQSITEFWRRWHLSLSTWLRDYLYIPLGGNRRGPARTYVNLAAVMLLGGLWHGAAWTFVAWGAIHGAMLIVERLRGKRSFYGRLPGFVRVGITFAILLFTWVFFRSPDFGSALRYLGAMLGFAHPPPGAALLSGLIYGPYYLGTMVLAACFVWGAPQTWEFTRRLSWPRLAWVGAVFVAALAVLATQEFNPFIYFIF